MLGMRLRRRREAEGGWQIKKWVPKCVGTAALAHLTAEHGRRRGRGHLRRAATHAPLPTWSTVLTKMSVFFRTSPSRSMAIMTSSRSMLDAQSKEKCSIVEGTPAGCAGLRGKGGWKQAVCTLLAACKGCFQSWEHQDRSVPRLEGGAPTHVAPASSCAGASVQVVHARVQALPPHRCANPPQLAHAAGHPPRTCVRLRVPSPLRQGPCCQQVQGHRVVQHHLRKALHLWAQRGAHQHALAGARHLRGRRAAK